MAADLRYNLQHVGDSFASAIEKTVDLAKNSARGIFLTYDINRLERSKRNLYRDIGARVAHLAGEGLTDIKRDDRLTELFATLSAIEAAIQTHQLKRDDMLQSCHSDMAATECSTEENQTKE
jgi:hypothetical protein